jgi:hypothetical protein
MIAKIYLPICYLDGLIEAAKSRMEKALCFFGVEKEVKD